MDAPDRAKRSPGSVTSRGWRGGYSEVVAGRADDVVLWGEVIDGGILEIVQILPNVERSIFLHESVNLHGVESKF